MNQKISQLLKSTTIVYVGKVAQLGLLFGATVLVARYLSPDEYGLVSVGFTFFSIFSVILTLGFDKGISRNLPIINVDSQAKDYVFTAFVVSLVISVLVSLILYFFSEIISLNIFNDSNLIPVVELFFLLIPVFVIHKLSIGVLRGLKLTREKVIIENILLPGTRFAGVVIVVVFITGPVISIVWTYIIGYLISALLGLASVFRKIELTDGEFSKESAISLVKFSSPLIISGFASKLLSDIDILLIGAIDSSTAVGIYNVIYPLGSLIATGVISVSYIYMPMASELYEKGEFDELSHLYLSSTSFISLMSMPIFIVMFFHPELVIEYTFGEQYSEGNSALAILVSGFLIHAILGPNKELILSFGKTKTLLILTTGVAIINIILNVFLIPIYSFEGATIATVISYMILNICCQFIIYGEINRTLINFKGILHVIVVSATYKASTMILPRFFDFSEITLIISSLVMSAPLYAYLSYHSMYANHQ